MAKHYIRLDIEFDDENKLGNSFAHIVIGNITHIIQEDMPYCKVIHHIHSPNRNMLDQRTVNPNISSLTPRK